MIYDCMQGDFRRKHTGLYHMAEGGQGRYNRENFLNSPINQKPSAILY